MSRESFQSRSHSQSNPRKAVLDDIREDLAAPESSRPSVLRTTLRLPSQPTIHPTVSYPCSRRDRPAAGEIVIFDRSWYNRAGVENVMGFASAKDVERFLSVCSEFEKYITDAGIILIKFWLEVGKDEQQRRFLARINDPLRQRMLLQP